MKPYFESGGVSIFCGDCREVVPLLSLPASTAVITDPPWGVDACTDYTRFSNGLSQRNHGTGIVGDSQPFDPTLWLRFRQVAFWGANCFAEKLPVGRWLVWLKKRDNQLGTFLSDAELCWVNKEKSPSRAPGVYAKRVVWHGFDREVSDDGGKVLHPTQKPVAIMAWTIAMAEVPDGSLILDPYAGSGTTLVAARDAGLSAVGVEVEERYCEVAANRLSQPVLQFDG